jgi:hypothetical protein
MVVRPITATLAAVAFAEASAATFAQEAAPPPALPIVPEATTRGQEHVDVIPQIYFLIRMENHLQVALRWPRAFTSAPPAIGAATPAGR